MATAHEAKLASMAEARKETLKRSGRENEGDPWEPNPGAPGQMDPPVTVVIPNPGPTQYVPPPPAEAAAASRPAAAAAAPKEAPKEQPAHPPLQRGT